MSDVIFAQFDSGVKKNPSQIHLPTPLTPSKHTPLPLQGLLLGVILGHVLLQNVPQLFGLH